MAELIIFIKIVSMKILQLLLLSLLCANQLYAQEIKPNFEAVQEKFIPDSNETKIYKMQALNTDSNITEQNQVLNSDTGVLIIEKGENFDLLLQEYLKQKKVSGYRIQLFAGGKRIDALKVKVDFMKLYPEQVPDIIYQQPNYKGRVGNYRTRLDANKYLELYKIDFPSAFIIKDYIKLETQSN